jgi:hypothetical protein
MPGLSLLIASRDVVSTETILNDFLANSRIFFDVDFLVEKFFELYHVIQTCLVLEDGHRVLFDIHRDWQEIDAAFNAVLDFLSPQEIREYFASKELYLAVISLLNDMRNSLHDRVFPEELSSPDNTMLQSQCLEIIKRYLFYPVITSHDVIAEYAPPHLEEVLRVKDSLFFNVPSIIKTVHFVSTFVAVPFLNLKRKIPPIMRTITFLAQHSPNLFSYFFPRWGEPLIGTRGGEITLPSRKEVYFFFHDWQFILDDFTLFNDLQKMRQLKNAYYGQRLGMHFTAQDLAWLI